MTAKQAKQMTKKAIITLKGYQLYDLLSRIRNASYEGYFEIKGLRDLTPFTRSSLEQLGYKVTDRMFSTKVSWK